MSMSDNANVWIKNVSRTYNEVYWFNTKTGESTWSIWINYVSRTYNEVYWFNTKTGESRWPEPTKENVAFDNHDTNSTSLGKRSLNLTNEEINPNNNKRLKKDQDTTSTTRETSQTPNGNSNISTNKVGIIVPFRDLHIEQHRKRHLEEFIPTMINLFTHAHTNFSIYVIEQSKDNRKFNRGKLLNIGFDLASKEGCNIFVFHDVDLIPSPELIPYYINKPHDQHPVHIARVWSRYNDNPNYFGGIVAFTEQQFRKVNGFPNNFWGWGGEDDELYQRVKKVIQLLYICLCESLTYLVIGWSHTRSSKERQCKRFREYEY
jgi:hypothetical protein